VIATAQNADTNVMIRRLATGMLLGILVLVGIAGASPDAATWRRQTLLGQNQDYFFRYVAVSDNPGSYYTYSRALRLEKVRKADFKIVESFVLRNVTYSQHPDTLVWREVSGPVDHFDLPGYLSANQINLAFADDLLRHRSVVIDSAGVWEMFEDGRIQLATRQELERQIPVLEDDPRVVGIEQTGWQQDTFLRIESGDATSDSNWAEDLLLIRVEMR
jgi:hypothetical protein